MESGKASLLRSLSIDRAIAPSRASPRRLPTAAAIGAAALIAVAGTLWGLKSPGAAKPAYEVVTAQAVTPAPANTPVERLSQPRAAGTLVASGYVVARRKATIASEITGKVKDLLVEEGQTVKAGQVLATLDSVLAEKDLALAKSRALASEAAVAAIEADLGDAERIFHRTEILSQTNAASEADLTKNRSHMEVLRAQLRQAQAQHQTDLLDAQRSAATLEKYAIRAPFPGVVIERSAQPGEMISPMSAGGFTRTGICTIVDMNSIEVEVDVNEAFIGRVHPETRVDAVLDAYADWTIPGNVIAIVPTANREKATVKVRIRLQQKDPRILPDMAIKVTFLEDATSGRTEIVGSN